MDYIQLFGPFGTGTNLLERILEKNVDSNSKIHIEGHTHIDKHTIENISLEKCIKNNKKHTFYLFI